jgi:antitoxin component YwqK of YwqJK toxin-antitoxin module
VRKLFLTAALLLVFLSSAFAQVPVMDTVRELMPDSTVRVRAIRNTRVYYEAYVDQQGLLHGTRTTYAANGFPNLVESFRHGKKHGFFFYLGLDGYVEAMAQYYDDIPHGAWRKYYKSAALAEELNFNMGLKDGPVYRNFLSGKKQEVGFYSNNKRVGTNKWFFENGNLSTEYNYTDGKLDGGIKEYYENGNIKTEGNYLNDKRVGLWKTYHDNGKVATEGSYTNGEAKGIWKTYDSEGKLIKTEKL